MALALHRESASLAAGVAESFAYSQYEQCYEPVARRHRDRRESQCASDPLLSSDGHGARSHGSQPWLLRGLFGGLFSFCPLPWATRVRVRAKTRWLARRTATTMQASEPHRVAGWPAPKPSPPLAVAAAQPRARASARHARPRDASPRRPGASLFLQFDAPHDSLATPSTAFGRVVAAGFDRCMSPDEWVDLTGDRADARLRGACLGLRRDEAQPKFERRYGVSVSGLP